MVTTELAGMVGITHTTACEVLSREDKVEGRRQKPICRYHQMGREADVLTILLFGLGVLIFIVGLCTGLYPAAHGFVGWVASWVCAFVVRRIVAHGNTKTRLTLNLSGDSVQ